MALANTINESRDLMEIATKATGIKTGGNKGTDKNVLVERS